MKKISSLKGMLTQTLVSGAVSLGSLALALAIAGALGAQELGLFAGWLAWSLIFWPLATLRIETRISLCLNESGLGEIFAATCTAGLIFLGVGGVFLAALVGWFKVSWVVIFVPFAAVSYAVLELSANAYAFTGNMRGSLLVRSVRQLAPFASSFTVSIFVPSGIGAFIGYSLAYISLALFFVVWRRWPKPSISVLRKVLLVYGGGLKASILLGCANAIWLNGFIPFLNYFGMTALAGQYSVVQRILNAPLAVLTAVVNSYMVRVGNELHRKAGLLILSAVTLVMLSLSWVSIVYWGVSLQSLYPVSDGWRTSDSLYWSISFFTISSFTVGALALVAVRLKDEWFLSAWQISLVFLGGGVLIWERSSLGLINYLLVGGLAYWVLFVRWVYLTKRAGLN